MAVNPLIQDLIENEAFPTATITLPSAGRWYNDDMFVKNTDTENLQVGVLGILAEQNYRDPWLLLSGEAIPRMLRSICPSILNANELCEIDLEAILLASRLVSFGPSVEIHHPCTAIVDIPTDELPKLKKDEDGDEIPLTDSDKTRACGFENKLSIDLNEHILRYDVITDEMIKDMFEFKISFIDQTVHFRCARYIDTINSIKTGMKQQHSINEIDDYDIETMVMDPSAITKYSAVIDLASEAALGNITAMIFGISTTDGEIVKGKDMISEWVQSLPTDEVERIVKQINKIAEWIQSLSIITYSCGECGSEQSFRMELDANRLFGSAGVSRQLPKPSRKSKRSVQKRRVR
jgi:hypothetical protein